MHALLLERGTLGWLVKLLVLGQCHEPDVFSLEKVMLGVNAKQPYLRSSTRIVSIVFSRFHWKRHGNLAGSTCGLLQHWFFHATAIVNTYLACPLVYTWKVDFGNELQGWRSIRVIRSAVNVQAVDTVLVCALLCSGP